MGNSCKSLPSTMMDNRVSEDVITVHFVHKDIKPLTVQINSDPKITCENVLQRCLQYVRPLIYNIPEEEACDPKFLPVFGLCEKAREVWLPLNHIFKETERNERHYLFRVRFRPPISVLFKNGTTNVMFEYLSLQLLHDFSMGPLGSNKQINDNLLFNLLGVLFLMPSALPFDGNQTVDKNFKEKDFHIANMQKYVSNDIRKRFISVLVIDHYWLQRNLKQEIKKYKERSDPLWYYKQQFCKLILSEIPEYCFERYQATSVGRDVAKDTVTLNICLYEENRNQPGLYYGDKLESDIKAIEGLKIEQTKDFLSTTCRVRLDVANEPPKHLDFESKDVAESFMSMVQGYLRLYVRYDTCLSIEYQSDQARISSDLHSFGPLSLETARDYLSDISATCSSPQKGFLVQESMTEFNSFSVICYQSHSPDDMGSPDVSLSITFEVAEPFQFVLKSGNEILETFTSVPLLKNRLKERYGRQAQPRCYYVIADICNFYDQNTKPLYYCTEDTEDTKDVDFFNGGVFLSSDFKDKEEIPDKNLKIRKFKVYKDSNPLMMVQLQEQEEMYAEAFREGLVKLVKLNRINRNNFLKFYGHVVEKKVSFLMEYAPFGDLLTYICKNPQTVSQKVNIARDIVKTLKVLEEGKLFHGDIRLRKFLVFEGDFESPVKIKLGNPGISSILDGLPLRDPENIKRLPWISPERRYKLQHITYESECYAVGTAICELLYRDDQFHDLLQLGQGETLLTYFESHEHLPPPPEPDGENALVPKAKEALQELWNIVISCWVKDKHERPCTRDLLKAFQKINMILSEVGEEKVVDKIKKVAYDLGLEEEMRKKYPHRKPTVDELQAFIQQHRQHYIPPALVKIGGRIDGGHYGVVYKGTIIQPRSNDQEPQKEELVAIKKMPIELKTEFFREIITAVPLKDRNIVQTLYISNDIRTGEVILIMEHMNRDSLRKYVDTFADHKNIFPMLQMYKICLDIAKGMRYLSGMGIVHCDLAARNVLLSQGPDGIVAKVADFGLARPLDENYRFYTTRKTSGFPFMWWPPECLSPQKEHKFSSQGDVFSFGITMWEAFSPGKAVKSAIPHGIGQRGDINGLYEEYKKGFHLAQTDIMPLEAYKLAQSCWAFNPKHRLQFVQIVQELEKIVQGQEKIAEETRLKAAEKQEKKK